MGKIKNIVEAYEEAIDLEDWELVEDLERCVTQSWEIEEDKELSRKLSI